ncbi:cation:proton antiporter [Sulfurovum sp. NBC37-1]|uniref:cation:proton antiporter n=1 Tax=Sulfurovum sp. (strain NBC37-1) TaxID=387093 RepID=UPI0001587D7D|nr:cation:proton antiporter [Sulfurovum sp. NBC37-1]BAF72936.1 Na+:H+ antiporter, NhaP family [Sulfurovum sp. NBC37-1]
MHEHLVFLGISLVVLGYGLFSKLLGRYNISGPMVFTGVGILLSPLVLGGEPIHANAEAVQVVAEITLILVLFSDSAALNLSQLKAHWRLPTRLLFVAMPVTIVIATLTAMWFFPNESTLYVLLLALILAPTDAALGKIVVSDERIPSVVRNTINVESGLNDGIVFPVLLTVLAMITSNSTTAESGWLSYIAQQVLVGALAGGVVGWAGAKVMMRAIKEGWMEYQYSNLAPIALAIFSFYMAEFVGGNGYIAAFFSGLFLGNTSEVLRERVESFAESEGEFLVMLSFLIFGLVFIPMSIDYWNLKAFAFAILSLTVLRMLPVVLGFGFFKVDLATRLFYGWFGPRGIASILYILVAFHELGSIQGHEEIFGVASLTIFLSIFLHGFSAQPLALLYAKSHPADEEEKEADA